MTAIIILFAVLSVITIALAIALTCWFWKQEGVLNTIAVVSTIVVIACIIAIWLLAWQLQDCMIININPLTK